ncbi:hypothetical protein NQ314_010550 [Rhamnusium bicolor]|uniref:Transposase n=1 Tax=Rhamnusium bicolor TaxID=1586634 RepID=A0AAV8XP76_9CUCU|nr:hypothetical protein NQ314_010550 [Rhamnusium bicolor]
MNQKLRMKSYFLLYKKRTKTPFKDDRPGQKWYLGFLRRHPEIRARTAETINKARATVTQEHIRSWLRELKSYLLEIHAADLLEDPSRIFNGDESGFSLCPKTGKVPGPKGFRNLYDGKHGNEKDQYKGFWALSQPMKEFALQ